MKYSIALLFVFFSNSIFCQEDLCGFKEECNCARTSIEKSFSTSAFILTGLVQKIDTVSISSLLQKNAADNLLANENANTHCAKQSLRTASVLQVEIQIQEFIKMPTGMEQKENPLTICTPQNIQNCAYQQFQIGGEFIIYGTINETADLYFHWTFDEDFFFLKPEFVFWTNHCKRTKVLEKKELRQLRKFVRKEKRQRK